MDIHDIVKRIVGPINPVGETNEDDHRFSNLKQMTKLVNLLLGDLSRVAAHKGRPEHSMSRAGKFADDFLYDVEQGE